MQEEQAPFDCLLSTDDLLISVEVLADLADSGLNAFWYSR